MGGRGSEVWGEDRCQAELGPRSCRAPPSPPGLPGTVVTVTSHPSSTQWVGSPSSKPDWVPEAQALPSEHS